ncbi:hypothetical protein HGRIS_010961 [Hohenbuehelia grisea]|uniref:Phytanoyl-CoA dioxygenase n=1 Tax=Hohenbuehelia grisea TaxID=104357 RepID=A0ABR3IYD0_9AGAR
MPGAIQVQLKAGETVFYNNNILHCAAYDKDSRRATLHASMGDVRGGSSRARNILQHGLEWMKDPRFFQQHSKTGKEMLRRLIALQESAKSSETKYSLQG